MYSQANSNMALPVAEMKPSSEKSYCSVNEENSNCYLNDIIYDKVNRRQDGSSIEKNTEGPQEDTVPRNSTPQSMKGSKLPNIVILLVGIFSTLRKVTSRFSILLGLLFLSGQFHVIKCSASIQPSTYNHNSTFSSNSLLSLFLDLVKVKPLNIQLLYDRANEEIAQHLSVQLSKEMSAVMDFLINFEGESIDLILRSATKHTSIVTLCNYESVLNIFDKINSKRMKSHHVNWILVLRREEWNNGTESALESLIFEGTHVTVIIQDTLDEFLLYSANVKEDGVMRLYYRGVWGSMLDGKRPQLPILYDPGQYSDMKGRQLFIAANHDPPFINLGEVQNDGSILFSGGFEVNIIQSFSKSFNFTYKVFSPADGAWGYPQPDGTVTGMIGMVARREVHFAVTGIGLNPVRNRIIDYSLPYFMSFIGIYSRSLREKSKDLAIFVPFRSEVWICIVVATLSIGPILRIHSKMLEKISSPSSSQNLPSYFFNTFRSLVIQGNLIESSSSSQRIIFFTWYIFCLIICVLYSGTLTAVFAVPAYEKPVDGLEDLPRAVRNGFTITVVGDTHHEYMFKEAKHGVYKETWELFNHADRSKSFIDTTYTGMRLVLEEKTLHIAALVNGKIMIARLGKQKFYVGRNPFNPTYTSFVLQQGSPLRKGFNQVLGRLFEAGLISKWEEDEIEKMPKDTSNVEESRLLVITLVHLQAAFFLLFLGYSMATMALIAENVFCITFLSGKSKKY